MEADGGGVGKQARQRPEPAEGERGIVLVEEPDGGGRSSLWIPRCKGRCGAKLTLRRTRPAEALEGDAVQDPVTEAAAARTRGEERQLIRRGESGQLRR